MYFLIAIVLVLVFVLITYSQVRTHTHAYPKWHVEVVSGMSNRIRAIVGLIYCSRILNRRLVVHWNKSDACNGLYSELFKSSNLFDLVEVENSSNPNPKTNDTSMKIIKAYLGDGHKIDFGVLNAIRCEATQPLPWIQRRIDEFCETYSIRDRIGLHVRETDLSDKYKSDIGTFENLVQSYDISQGFFIASDNKKRYEHMISKYDNIVGFSSEDFHDQGTKRETSLQRALIDLEILARCKSIIQTSRSSFSKLAEKKRITCNKSFQKTF